MRYLEAWREIDETARQQWLDWLTESAGGDGVPGFDASGWPAATWVRRCGGGAERV